MQRASFLILSFACEPDSITMYIASLVVIRSDPNSMEMNYNLKSGQWPVP